ncbi:MULTISPECIES: N-acetylmuramoyl-L-alanine amidase family protein [unclassified Pedobacter]|uniref:N-acetylmuramoyl-L-alanine amidase family protein n=1 Tax=Pedobacter TaxID=84567 RepID=UPI00209C1429|nr:MULTISPECIES: N-acetylmuramoyl-L-alanine amidase [unclassified Pedobacter]MCX2430418.1 N-acetylmuramoyl-L-alanine amidase [Pedobacter sp. GR22-10]MCX2585526.1 N-acetylmuramoyl-L-alanine amidase [Pedobacter sp. MR22-3]
MFNQKRSKLVKNIPLMYLKTILTFIIYFALVNTIDNQAIAQGYKIKTIVIDAGHGGKDGATHGIYSKEKDVALKTALNLGKALQDSIKDIKVVYTRETDVFIPLYERINIANNAKADLFISIHLNDMPVRVSRVVDYYKKVKGRSVPVYKTIAAKSTSTKGTETFVSGTGRLGEQDEVIKRENASMFLEDNYQKNYEGFIANTPENDIMLSLMKQTNRDRSLKFASLLQQEYVNAGRINRGVQEKSLAVLARAAMPAVLTEIGFVSNPDEEDYMNSPEGQKEIVDGIIKAIKNYKRIAETSF